MRTRAGVARRALRIDPRHNAAAIPGRLSRGMPVGIFAAISGNGLHTICLQRAPQRLWLPDLERARQPHVVQSEMRMVLCSANICVWLSTDSPAPSAPRAQPTIFAQASIWV